MSRKIDIVAERDFENIKVSDNSVRSAQGKYYWCVEPSINKFNEHILSVIKDKEVLEIGCSTGYMASSYLQTCSRYTGVDVSDKAIEIAEQSAIEDAKFLTCDAHQLPFKDKSFDIVLVNGLLHHLNLPIALDEIHRVLNKKGKLILKEPMGINPIFNLYRWSTPRARTIDEKPFEFTDLKELEKLFIVKSSEYVGLTVLVSAFIKSTRLRRFLLNVDKYFSKSPAKYLYWHFLAICEKK